MPNIRGQRLFLDDSIHNRDNILVSFPILMRDQRMLKDYASVSV